MRNEIGDSARGYEVTTKPALAGFCFEKAAGEKFTLDEERNRGFCSGLRSNYKTCVSGLFYLSQFLDEKM
jgi:hypothetical protein